MKLRIGTRGSELALWQSNRIQSLLKNQLHVDSEIIIIKTQGDVVQNIPLSQLDGKGFFTKELEDSLLENKIDLAVHSLKDLPTTLPEKLKIAALSERENSRDRLIIRKDFSDFSQPFFLKKKSVVGTSSNRRIDQVKSLQPDLKTEMLRGNVPTRIQKLRDGKYDAIILAAAGVDRLGIKLDEFDVVNLDQQYFVPAPGQGALAIEIRESDPEVEKIISQLHSPEIASFVREERRFLQLTEGGCHASVGAFAHKNHNRFYLTTFWNDGENSFKISVGKNNPEKSAEKSFDLHKKLHKKNNETVWIVREKEKSVELAEILKKTGRKVICESAISTVSNWEKMDEEKIKNHVSESEWIFFTSPNSVRYFFEKKIQFSEKIKFASVGSATDSELKKYGFSSSLISPEGTSESLAKEFLGKFMEKSGQIFFPTTSETDDFLETVFSKTKWKFLRADIYSTEKKSINAKLFSDQKIGKVVLYSSSACEVVGEFLKSINQNPKWISIGPKTSETIRKIGFSVYSEAEYPETGNILESIIMSDISNGSKSH